MGAIWDSVTSGIIDYAMSAYDGLGVFVYPMVFLAILGFVYAGTQSIIALIVGIILTFGIYLGIQQVNIFQDVPEITIFLYVVTIMGVALLITALYIKRRG